MLRRKKYIIWTLLIFSAVFISFYIITKLFSRQDENDFVVPENFIFIVADTTKQYKEGKTLFFQQCAACHILFRDLTGPDLVGFTKRGPWTDKKKVLSYLADPFKFYKENKSKYVDSLYESSPVSHPAFLWNEKKFDDFIYYLKSEEKIRKK